MANKPRIDCSDWERDQLSSHMVELIEHLIGQLKAHKITPGIDAEDSAVLYEVTRHMKHRTVVGEYGWMERKPCAFLTHPKPKEKP